MLLWTLALAHAADVCAGDCPFPTLQDAIDSVPDGGSATFIVEPGTHDGRLRIDGGRDITLSGPLPTLAPIVLTASAPGDDAVITVDGAALTLAGIAIDGDLVRAIDADASDISITLGSLFGRGLGTRGGLVSVRGGSLTTQLVGFRDGHVSQEGGLLWVRDAEVHLQGTTFEDGGGSAGGCAFLQSTGAPMTVEIVGGVFRDCQATFAGGGLTVDGPVDLRVEGVLFERSTASDGGAVAITEGPTADLEAVRLTDNEAFGLGGGLLVRNATAVLRAARVASNRAGSGGGIALTGPADLTLEAVTLTGNEALDSGGGVHVENGTYRATDAVFTDNVALQGNGGGLFLGAIATWHTDVRTTMCANTAFQGGGIFTNSGDDAEVRNLRLLDNVATEEGGGIAHRGDGALHLAFANLLGNSAGLGAGAALVTTGPVRIDDVLIGWSIGSVAALARNGGTIDVGPSAWWANEQGDLQGLSPTRAQTVFVDPLLDRYAPGEPCEVAQDWPAFTSPLRDAGTVTEVDPDGTRADLGAYGGPDAPPHVWVNDFDGDGFPLIFDCNDGDATVNPGVDDPPYDGLDSDCDRGDDYDADRDGVRALDYGGLDCDDDDPLAYPGAPEDPTVDDDQNCDGVLDADLDGYARDVDCDDADPLTFPGAPDDDNRVDRNCDGVVDGPRVFQTASCTTGAGPVTWLTALFVVALGRRRRVAC